MSSRSTHSNPVFASIFVFFLFGFVADADDDDVPVEEEDDDDDVASVPTVSTSPVLEIVAVAVLDASRRCAFSFLRCSIILLISSRFLTLVMLVKEN